MESAQWTVALQCVKYGYNNAKRKEARAFHKPLEVHRPLRQSTNSHVSYIHCNYSLHDRDVPCTDEVEVEGGEPESRK